ncbi:histone-lysine N-methyltransferase SETMAR [Trichonephila clavipes]|uniref:Histone-lysine N-methyltransferase SETMAR n=1 Tax=Trichonephila clavipes TaxID=2585209 RepID=A0A8X6SHD7_TRICX|nr:histone-lysine N-methyltransferase SETMAR [Trichonephila clavipes]
MNHLLELLPPGQILNSDIYCQQLDHLKLAIDQKRPELVNRRGVVFHQDNARPHTSVVTRLKLWELGWEVLMHPPYSLDLVPSKYHLFLALQNLLSDKKLGSRKECENRIPEFFTRKERNDCDVSRINELFPICRLKGRINLNDSSSRDSTGLGSCGNFIPYNDAGQVSEQNLVYPPEASMTLLRSPKGRYQFPQEILMPSFLCGGRHLSYADANLYQDLILPITPKPNRHSRDILHAV